MQKLIASVMKNQLLMKQQSQCCDNHKERDDHSEWADIADGKLKEPATVKEALASPGKDKWMNAMKKILALYK